MSGKNTEAHSVALIFQHQDKTCPQIVLRASQLRGSMKKITTAMAALAVSAMMSLGTTDEAKADGGAIAIGVGAYLITDAIVGRKCHRQDWPFNIIAKIADEIHGQQGCYRGKPHYSRDDRHHRKYR